MTQGKTYVVEFATCAAAYSAHHVKQVNRVGHYNDPIFPQAELLGACLCLLSSAQKSNAKPSHGYDLNDNCASKHSGLPQ